MRLQTLLRIWRKPWLTITPKDKQSCDLTDLNKKLIQRCGNMLSREQELSAPEVISYLMGGVTEMFLALPWNKEALTLKYHVIVYHQRRYTTHRVSAARYLAAMDTKIYRGSRARTTSPVSTGMTAAPANARLALRPGSPQLGTHVD
jgi:hypothetical protein